MLQFFIARHLLRVYIEMVMANLGSYSQSTVLLESPESERTAPARQDRYYQSVEQFSGYQGSLANG